MKMLLLALDEKTIAFSSWRLFDVIDERAFSGEAVMAERPTGRSCGLTANVEEREREIDLA